MFFHPEASSASAFDQKEDDDVLVSYFQSWEKPTHLIMREYLACDEKEEYKANTLFSVLVLRGNIHLNNPISEKEKCNIAELIHSTSPLQADKKNADKTSFDIKACRKAVILGLNDSYGFTKNRDFASAKQNAKIAQSKNIGAGFFIEALAFDSEKQVETADFCINKAREYQCSVAATYGANCLLDTDPQSYDLYKEAAEGGDLVAMNRVGFATLAEKTSVINKEQAEDYVIQSARNGCPSGIFNAGKCFHYSLDEKSRDLAKAARYYRACLIAETRKDTLDNFNVLLKIFEGKAYDPIKTAVRYHAAMALNNKIYFNLAFKNNPEAITQLILRDIHQNYSKLLQKQTEERTHEFFANETYEGKDEGELKKYMEQILQALNKLNPPAPPGGLPAITRPPSPA